MNEIVLTVLKFDNGNSSLAITRKRQPFGLPITKERQLLKESSNRKTYSSLPITKERQLILKKVLIVKHIMYW